MSWSWNLSNRGVAETGAGGGASKPKVFDLSITKYVDTSSTQMALKLLTSAPIATADLVVRKAGEKPLEYIKLKMEDVFVTSYSTGGSGGEDRLTENVTLNFRRICVAYTPQLLDGSSGATQETCWDNATGTTK